MAGKLASLVVASAVLAVFPAAASAQSHQHDLFIDKQEQFVDLNGLEQETHTMTCSSGRIALNGSVKVDAVDSPGHPQFVDTVVSRGFGQSSWRFVVKNGNLQGRAQLKLFIVCIGSTAGEHQVLLGPPGTDPASAVAEDNPAFDGEGSIAVGEDSERNPSCPGVAPASPTERDPTMFPVRPGLAADPSPAQIEGSEPLVFAFNGAGSPFGLLSRDWLFRFDTGGNDIALNAIGSIRCLGTHVGTASGHNHAYDVSYQQRVGNVSVPAGTRTYDVTVGCPKRNGSFGIIGTHSEFGAGKVTGSEPRGDVWAFRLSNRGTTTAFFGLGVICLEKRVWNSDGSFPPPAPIPQTIETATTTENVEVSGGGTRAAKRFDVSCDDPAHYVLSGSASFGSAGANELKRIAVTESRATEFGSWRFRIANGTSGDLKSSLRLVCAAPWTEGHALPIGGLAEDRLRSGKAACGNGQFPVQSGYAGREPSLSVPLHRGDALEPGWQFEFEGGPADVSVNCLSEETTLRTNHFHRLFASFEQEQVSVPAGEDRETKIKCPAGRRAIAGTLDVRGSNVRIAESRSIGRSWIFRLANPSKNAPVAVGATCLAAKTTGEIYE